MPLGMIAHDSLQNMGEYAKGDHVARASQRPNQKEAPSIHRRQYSIEANPQQPPSFHYAGQFSDDYYFNESYHNNHELDLFPRKQNSAGSFLCCVFPWLAPTPTAEKVRPHQTTITNDAARLATNPTTNQGDEETESKDSSSSNILGERLSEKERQAVLARLRLAQPAQASPSPTPEDQQPLEESTERMHNKKSLLSGIPAYETSETDPNPPYKSILKTKGTLPTSKETNSSLSMNSLSKDSVASLNSSRRSLFPTTYEGRRAKFTKTVSFAPLARVVNIKSRNDMESEEKAAIWWQRSDYEDFRKTGRIITRAMLEGGGEIWLRQVSTDNSATGDIVSAPGDKWWHKFGHSRRGLEHVVSVDEGRQRQMNVKTAIHAVLEEQERQKLRSKTVDQEKLRSVALHYTSWARDLALASGSSDADAVRSSFANDRRSREFYLLKMARTSPETTRKTHNVPEFMQPLAHLRPAARPLLHQSLDANTAAQIQMRRRKSKLHTGSHGTLSQKKPLPSDVKVENTVPVHDSETESKSSMAQQAAGFAADGEKIDMAAVLSGMGAGLGKKDQPMAPLPVAT